jgi:hypothetical protein
MAGMEACRPQGAGFNFFILSFFPSAVFQFKSREWNSVTDSFCEIDANGGMGFKVEDAKTVSAKLL